MLRGLRLRRDTADFGPEGRTEDAGRKVSSRPRGPVRDSQSFRVGPPWRGGLFL